MNQRTLQGLRRRTLEVLSIVASILLAFSIDAWWAHRSERRQERVALAGLAAESRSNRVELADHIVFHQRRMAALELLGGVATGRVAALSADSLNHLLDAMLGWRTFDPQTATLDALEGAGHLDVISSDALRTILASWRSKLDDASGTQAALEQSIIGAVFEWFRRSGPPMPDLGGRAHVALLPSKPVDVEPYLKTDEFLSLAAQQHRIEFFVVFELQGLDAVISDILGTLDSALGRLAS